MFTKNYMDDCKTANNIINGKTCKKTQRTFADNLRPKKTDTSLLLKLYIDPVLWELLNQIFQWNPNWLDEENHIGGPPPLMTEDKLVAMLPMYESHEEYCKIIKPLMTLELRHKISRDNEEEKRGCWNYRVSTWKTDVKLCMNILELYITHEDQKALQDPPAHGDLVIFDYMSEHRKAFAYVARAQKHGKYTMLMKPMNATDLRTGKLRPVSCIRPDMRSFQALHYLPESPLRRIILHPRVEDYRLPATNNLDSYRLVTKDCLNAKQLEAVVRVTEAVAQELPRICLIQGPPGTGKSRVIVNMIIQIIRSGHACSDYKKTLLRYRKTRILMCAPSNTAVDEVVLRLTNVNRTLEAKKRSFRLVRIGRAETMNPLVKEVSLRELAKKRVQKLDLNATPRTTAIICREESLLLDADVIACTFNSCYTDQMASIFGRNKAISVCIIDEATQCVEPDALIPLMLGVKTLVLVGDTKQLPATVLSQKAKQLGLDQSLFARISEVVEGELGNLIIKLDTQYRMSNPIALFPNRHFYNGALKNAARMRNLPLHFYRVFNLNSTQSFDKFSNSNEANFVANLMYTLIARANYDDAILPVKIGVITPYNNQKKLLRKRISERISCLKDQKKIEYEVNTVDSFQGQERDIVIMSCVRSNGIGFLADRQRLCVALTRAKHSLILCGNFKTFENNPTWKALLKDAKDRKVYINLQASANPCTITTFVIC